MTVDKFIQSEQERFPVTSGLNELWVVFSYIQRYREFLEVVVSRYYEKDKEYEGLIDNEKDVIESRDQKRDAEWRQSYGEVSLQLHLEIESFYLFSKLLLDRTAFALWYYFGKDTAFEFRTHKYLFTNLEKFVAAKGLKPPSAYLVKLLEDLKLCIIDYRNNEVVHEYDPRSFLHTTYSLLRQRATKRSRSLINPNENELSSGKIRARESKPIGDLLSLIDKYLENILDFMILNREKVQ